MTDDEGSSQSASTAAAQRAGGIASPWWLIAVLAGSAALALVVRREPAAKNSSAAQVSSATSAHSEVSRAPEETGAIAGKVVERLDVPSYTYLALETAPGGARTWVAVTRAEVEIGRTVRLRDAHRMTNFTSTALKRTFDTIYFGVLDAGGVSSASASRAGNPADPHAGIPGAPPLGGGAPVNLHGGPAPHGESVTIGKVRRAEGPSGHTVLQTTSRRRELAGQKVRVRGVVVKVTSGVLDRNFLRVRDGSETGEVRDLIVTTRVPAAVGEQVLVEGKVTTDKDFGAGYVYSVLLEDAEILAREPAAKSAP